MYILVTNDDGISSEGLLALKQALAKVGTVAVIAPDHNWSAAGHSKTMHKPLRIQKVKLPDGDYGYSTDGAPSDCVAIGVLGFLPDQPGLVVSGINKGANLGDDITYSGTVAAAMEGSIFGLPAIAVSLVDYSPDPEANNFAYAADFAARLAAHVLDNGLGNEVLLNVNVPNLTAEKVNGVEITRLGKRVYRDELIERTDPYGRKYYWIGGERPSGIIARGTDIKAIAEGKVSVTPIHLDLTHHRLLKQLRAWDLKV